MAFSRCAIAAAVVLCCAACALADVASIPAAAPVNGTSMCAVVGWEYAARWDLPFNILEVLSVEECAQLCEIEPACTGATFIASGTAQLNCWLKSWGEGAVPPPCRSEAKLPSEYQALFIPAGEECSGVTYMDSPVFRCRDEALIEQDTADGASDSPEPAAVSGYHRYPGRDIIPYQEPNIQIEDIGRGIWADTLTDCEAECDAVSLCNALAFLSEPINNGNSNCYLKMMDSTCVLPQDATYWPRATFSMRKCDPETTASAAKAAEAAAAAEGPESTSEVLAPGTMGSGSGTNAAGAGAPEPAPAGTGDLSPDLSEPGSTSGQGSNEAAFAPRGAGSREFAGQGPSGSNARKPAKKSGSTARKNERTAALWGGMVGAGAVAFAAIATLVFLKCNARRAAALKSSDTEASSSQKIPRKNIEAVAAEANADRPSLQAREPSGTAFSHTTSSTAVESETVKAVTAAAGTTTVSIHYNPSFSGDDGTSTSNTQAEEILMAKPPTNSVPATTVSIPATAHNSLPLSKLLVNDRNVDRNTDRNANHANFIKNLEPGALKDSTPKLKLVQEVSSDAGAIGKAAATATESCMLDDAPTRTGESESRYATVAELAVVPVPAKGAPRQEWKEHLEQQLDSLLGQVVHGSLKVLHGRHQRLAGGQAVVQIVEDTENSTQYAVKFFLSPGAFRQERALYEDKTQPLGRFLPQLKAIAEGEGTGLRDAHGTLMPPCIIMEKGEALDVWIESSGEDIDLFTGLQVLSHIAERLKALHEAGYVHRDIKPGNIMWLPRTKRWTLIDFGCAAPAGTHAPTGFSLFYAAPEALTAYVCGEGGLQAEEALDAWSLGVLAIELLSGTPVFDNMTPKDQITEMILGVRKLPWEDPELEKDYLRPLGIFKMAVLKLLARDPSKRSTIHQFQLACKRVMANNSMTNSTTTLIID